MAFSNKKNKRRQASAINGAIDTLLGPQAIVEGDIHFSGGLHIDGLVKGNVIADSAKANCYISEKGRVIGELHVSNINIDGTIDGDVYSAGLVELAPNARIKGSVYYKLLDVAVGAQVNGKLMYRDEPLSEEKPQSTKEAANAAVQPLPSIKQASS